MRMCSPASFYGTTSSSSSVRLSRLERAGLLANPGHDLRPGAAWRSAARTRLRPSSSLEFPQEVAAFSTQDAALDWTRKSASDAAVRVFSHELDASGRRCFVACHPRKMYQMVWARKRDKRYGRKWTGVAAFVRNALFLSERNFYEVIPQGEPCKLYFDLEFGRAENPEGDGIAATQLLVRLVIKKVRLLGFGDVSYKTVGRKFLLLQPFFIEA